jgi:hypothetical protein
MATENIEAPSLSLITKDTTHDILLNQAHELLKEGYKPYDSMDSVTKLHGVSISDGNNTYTLDAPSGNLRFMSHSINGQVKEGEIFDHGKLSQRLVQKDNESLTQIFDKTGHMTSSVKSEEKNLGSQVDLKKFDSNGKVVEPKSWLKVDAKTGIKSAEPVNDVKAPEQPDQRFGGNPSTDSKGSQPPPQDKPQDDQPPPKGR